MFFALVAAGVADLGAEFADIGDEVRSAAHVSGGLPADARAVDVELDAADHFVDVGFVEAGVGAVFAGLCAFDTRFDAVLMISVCHGGDSCEGFCYEGKVQGAGRNGAGAIGTRMEDKDKDGR